MDRCFRYGAILLLAIPLFSSCDLLQSSTGKTTSTHMVSVVEETNKNEVSQSSKNIYGEWIIYQVGNKRITGEERPYIIFDDATQRFYGSNGCNTINGDFTVTNDNGIKFENVLTTQRSCADAPYEFAINQAINNSAYFSVGHEKRVTYMSLYDINHNVIMALCRYGLDYLNGAWRIVEINGKDCDDESAQLLIDISELKLHGNTGCNILNGTILIDYDKENSIMFQQLVTTKMAASDKAQQETAILIALEEVESCTRGKNNTAILCDNKGRQVLVLKKIDDK